MLLFAVTAVAVCLSVLNAFPVQRSHSTRRISNSVDGHHHEWLLVGSLLHATRAAETDTSSSSTTSAASTTTTSAASPRWFATRIQETLDYPSLVQSMYLRHCVLETKAMADLAIKEYLSCKNATDPFGQVASSLSACALSREEAGKIGWVDPIKEDGSASSATLLPTDVVRSIYALEPKSGDVHIVQSTATQQFHVVLVEELLVAHQRDSPSPKRQAPAPFDDDDAPVGTFAGRNALLPVRTLKGQGITPVFPAVLEKYMVQTSGCQMNVADSERLAGVLENELHMVPTDLSDDADVILFNTCSIRDHAEQKLYDKLGPFAAQKRNGRKLALVVTGCVAQQEGEALLRRIPEVDVVLGPQYVPFLKNVLESVEWGRQVVATAPMLHQEASDFSKPVRGHAVRAWVNVINGCNGTYCVYC